MNPPFRRVLVATATYNEQSNITCTVKNAMDALPGCDMLVVDDNSPDGTGELLDVLAKTEPRLTVIHRPAKLGVGSAHKLAMVYSVKHNYDVLLTLDADRAHDPRDLPRLLDTLQKADCVIGARYMPGGQCDYRGSRRALSVIANLAAGRLLGTGLHEATTSLRGFRTSSLRQLPFHRIRSNGYAFFFEVLSWISAAGFRCKQIPVHFHDQSRKPSKISKIQVLVGLAILIRLLLYRMVGRLTQDPPSQLPEAHCYFCHSPYLVERHKAKGDSLTRIASVRCTAMDHGSKPQVMQCLECGLAYVPGTQKKPASSLTDLYADVEDQTYLEHQKARYKTFGHLMRVLKPHLPDPGKMLELGSYCGLFLKLARHHGWKVTGIEPSRWGARYARENFQLDVRTGTLSDHLKHLDRDYDAIVAWDVLEHFEDPVSEIRRVRRLLTPGGLFCFSTLDIDNWFPRLLGQHWPWIMQMHLF